MNREEQGCELCRTDIEKGDTLYYSMSWDGGIEYNYIHNIKYCPKCGRELPDD